MAHDLGSLQCEVASYHEPVDHTLLSNTDYVHTLKHYNNT